MTSHAVLDDMSHFWMPFTANRQFKMAPRLFESAKGMYYWTSDGQQILDACAGLWCINAGHCRKEIISAVSTAMAKLDYAPTVQFGHPLAFEAASKVARLMPEGLNRIFFTNSGSEAVDTALKIALAYHRARGEGQRTCFIGRDGSYHGAGFGGMSVGGIGANRKAFSGSLLPRINHMPTIHNLEHNAFSRGQPAWGAHLADELERLIAVNDPSTIAAVIVDPTAGTVLVPPQGYLQRLREITAKHGILLIFDEVITGFGRLGKATASEFFGVTPDLLTMAKAINSGAIPMGGVAAHQRIYDTIVDGTEPEEVELFHGYTYSAHPTAAAAAIAALNIYHNEKLFDRAALLAPIFEDAVHALRDVPYVKDIRNIGLCAAIELEPRLNGEGNRAKEAFAKCFEAGVLIRQGGNILAFAPPLIIDEAQIGQIFETVRKVLVDIK